MPATLVIADLPLAHWQTFYEIIGSAAGTLIGLQFVVIALISNVRKRVDVGALHAFGTPTVVHFCGALIIAAVMSAPWPSIFTLSIALGLYGLYGIVYAVIVFLRTRRQTDHKTVTEDWLWYVAFPSGVYVALTVASLFLRGGQVPFFVIAAAALFFLLIGIHNAWDTVTFIVTEDENTTSP